MGAPRCFSVFLREDGAEFRSERVKCIRIVLREGAWCGAPCQGVGPCRQMWINLATTWLDAMVVSLGMLAGTPTSPIINSMKPFYNSPQGGKELQIISQSICWGHVVVEFLLLGRGLDMQVLVGCFMVVVFSHTDRSQQNPVDGIAMPFQLNIEHADPFGSLVKGLQYHLLPLWGSWGLLAFVQCVAGMILSTLCRLFQNDSWGESECNAVYKQLFNRAGSRSLSTIVQKSYQKIPDHSVCKSLEVHLPDEFLSIFCSGVNHPWESDSAIHSHLLRNMVWRPRRSGRLSLRWDNGLIRYHMFGIKITTAETWAVGFSRPTEQADPHAWKKGRRCLKSWPTGQLVGISSSQHRCSLWGEIFCAKLPLPVNCQVNWHSKMEKSHQWFTFSHPAIGWMELSFIEICWQP